MDTKGSKVGKTTESIRSDSVCAEGERVVRFHDALKVSVSDELVLNKLSSEELRNAENLAARDTLVKR